MSKMAMPYTHVVLIHLSFLSGCQTTDHSCDSGCVPSSLICNGFHDCADGTDETDCELPENCKYKTSIKNYVCYR